MIKSNNAKIFACALLSLINFQSFSSMKAYKAKAESAGTPVATKSQGTKKKNLSVKMKKSTILSAAVQPPKAAEDKPSAPKKQEAPVVQPPQGSIEDDILICGFKFFKLSILRFEQDINSMKEPKVQIKARFMLQALKSMPFAIMIDSLNGGHEKEPYFAQEMQKHCKQNIKRCQKCEKQDTSKCEKFEKESDAFRKEIHDRDAVEEAFLNSGLNSTVLIEAYRTWSKKNDAQKLAHIIAPNKDLKTVSDLLDAV
jgi:hypothetical protein